MRLSTYLLALALALLCFTSFVLAQDDATASPAEGEAPSGEVPLDGEAPTDAPSNPWVKQKLTGLPIGENSALAVPVPILLAIFFAFLGAVGYGVWMIFDSDKQRARKQEEIKAKRAAKEAKKGSKKK